MKTIKALDLVKHRLILLPTPKEEELLPKEKILIKNDREHLVVKIIAILTDQIPENKEDKWKFEKKLNQKELKEYEAAQKDEKAKILKAQKMADKLNLPMKMFASRVGWQKKIISFFFTCEEAVDFRQLLKNLGTEFKSRIHLERVGARDKAKIIGGFGTCGQETCCSTFKTRLTSVPMDAARDQGIMIKANENILGLCGKLKCCLLYELPQYREKRKSLPHIRQTVTTQNNQKGRVIGLDILNQKVKVALDDTNMIEVFEVKTLKF